MLPKVNFVHSANCSLLGHGAQVLHLRKWLSDQRTHKGMHYSANIATAANYVVLNCVWTSHANVTWFQWAMKRRRQWRTDVRAACSPFWASVLFVNLKEQDACLVLHLLSQAPLDAEVWFSHTHVSRGSANCPPPRTFASLSLSVFFLSLVSPPFALLRETMAPSNHRSGRYGPKWSCTAQSVSTSHALMTEE